jgi:hypothetical protein
VELLAVLERDEQIRTHALEVQRETGNCGTDGSGCSHEIASCIEADDLDLILSSVGRLLLQWLVWAATRHNSEANQRRHSHSLTYPRRRQMGCSVGWASRA